MYFSHVYALSYQSVFNCSSDLFFQVPQLQNRYIVGSILSEGENEVDEEVQKRYETKGYKV